MLRQLAELPALEELTLRSALPHAKALDIAAVPHSLQRLAYQSLTSFIHLVSPTCRDVVVDRSRILLQACWIPP